MDDFPKEDPHERKAPTFTNAMFLKEVFKNASPDERVWVLSKPNVSGSNWRGRLLDDDAPTEEMNNYTSISTLIVDCRDEEGRISRTKVTKHSTHFIVLDDANLESLPLEPSYVIETSPGSFQVGYLLIKPERDTKTIDNLMVELGRKGVCRNDTSGNNSVRVVRLPQGRHSEKQAFVETRLWEPTRRYTIEELSRSFNVSYGTEVDLDGAFIRSTPEDSMARFAQNIQAVISGSDYHDAMNRIAARMISKGSDERDTVHILQAFMNLAKMNERDAARWQARYDDIERSVETAVRKFRVQKIEDPSKSAFTLHEYSGEFKATEWVIDGFLAWGITVIAGAPGVGKTSKIVALAALVAHLCRPDHELKPSIRRRVVYITEDAFQVERLIAGILKYGETGLTLEEFKQWFEIRNAHRLEPEAVAAEIELYTRAGATIGHMGFIARPLIVLDTSNATLNIEDENSNAEVGSFISAIKGSLNGSPLWVVAHTAKTLGRSDVKGLSARGAGAFEGDANATAYVFQEDEILDQRFMRLGKHRYESDCDELSFSSDVKYEDVVQKWGGIQTVAVRLADPEKSTKATREIVVEMKKREKIETKRITGKDETWNRIQDDIATFLRQNPGSSKKAIAKGVPGKDSVKAEIIAAMLSSGMVMATKNGAHDVYSVNDEM